MSTPDKTRTRADKMRLRAFTVTLLAAVLGCGGFAASSSAAEFDPRPLSEAKYGVTAPGDPDARPEQRDYVDGVDGTPLYVETYLPKPLPGKVPVVLIASPYEGTDPIAPATGGGPQKHHEKMAHHWAARGYAVSIAHVRGTANSGGCLAYYGALEQGDMAELVEWAGRGPRWTNGKVGMYGISYQGTTQLEAATSANRKKTRYLKAIVPLAPVTSVYSNFGYDGVMDSIAPLAPPAQALVGAFPRATALEGNDASKMLERPGCHGEHLSGSSDLSGSLFSGNFNTWYREREHRARAGRIRAATLYVQGLYDTNVLPTGIEGFFDRIPSDVPHKAIIGQWSHAVPDGSLSADAGEPQARYRRSDWTDMASAWFDRWLKDLPTGAEDWPPVQVQDSTGKWRVEPGFPATTGTAQSLALGRPDGNASDSRFSTLGADDPTGSTPYREDSVQGPAVGTPPAGGAVFETGPLTEALHVTGRPLLDLWLELEDPDAHVVASLEPLAPVSLEPLAPDADSPLLPVANGPIPGRRSAQHLEPLVDGRFEQEQPVKPDTGKPVHVPVRIAPADFVVPKGGRLRVVVTGIYNYHTHLTSVPSGGHGTVRILHDRDHPSALRFTAANPAAEPLEVKR